MMKNKNLRVLTIALAVWLLLVYMPISAFAELLKIEATPIKDETVYVLAEDASKRSEFEKHYYCSDGTFVAVTYPEAVHYKDESGEWVDVDLRLASDASAASYESQSGAFKTVFSKPSAAGDASVMANGAVAATPTISMQSGEHNLSWSLSGTKTADSATASANVGNYALNPVATNESVTLSVSTNAQMQVLGELKTAAPALSIEKIPVTDPNAFSLPAATNQVVYEDVFGADQNVSVRYSVSMNKIEEDILITAPTEMTSFSMQIECGELSPVKNPDNSIDFLDNYGNMVYHVSTPYLADAAFAVSYDVDVTLTVLNGVCTVTYTPDAEWMNAPEREYPIMLDPAVTTNDYTSAIMDTYVVENDTSGYYTSQYLYFNPNGSTDRIAVIRIQNLPSIDAAMPIVSAKLCLAATSTQNANNQVTLSTVQDGFNVLTGNYSALISNMVNSQTIASESLKMITEFDITNYISDVYTGNIGKTFAIHCDTGNTSSYVFPFHSMESTNTGMRPYLTITYGYNLPEGLSVGDEITIQNAYGGNSGGYLYPNSGLIGNGNSVLHAPGSNSSNSYKELTLRRNAANGTYRLEYTPAATTSNVYLSANTTTKKVVMHNTTSVPNNIKQDWLIVPYSINTFKIVLASDMRYVMTAVGNPTSYLPDPSNATEGYVSVTQCTGEPTARQQWKIYKAEDPISNVIVNSPPIDLDYRYINNPVTGKFLKASLDALNTVGFASGRVNDLGDSIQWTFTRLPDGYFTIQNKAVPDKLLTGTGLPTFVMAASDGTISNNQKWAVSLGITTYTITNVGTGQILAETGYIRSTWRMVKCSNYVELGTFSFSNLSLVCGETVQLPMPLLDPYPNSPGGAIHFTSANDFLYDVNDESVATVNSSTGVVNAVGRGTTRVDVTHKVTGEQQSFYVTVEKKAIIVLPGFLGSELFVGEGHTYFKEGAPIFSTEAIGILSELNTALTPQQFALLIGALALSTPTIGEAPVIGSIYVIDFVNKYFDALQCNNDGTSKHNLYTKKYIHVDRIPGEPCELPSGFDEKEYTTTAGTANIYYDLMDTLHSNTSITSKYSIELFSYDWRLSNGYSAERLDAFIEENDYDKVILITHSLGGLVASGYLGMGTEQVEKVEGIYFLASPLLGVPELANIWYEEDISSIEEYLPYSIMQPIINCATFFANPIQNLICNYASVYEAFPSEYYFQYTNDWYLSIQQEHIIDGDTITEYKTYETTKTVLINEFPKFNSALMLQAEDFHDSTFLSTEDHVSNLVTSFYCHCLNQETNADEQLTDVLMPNKYILKKKAIFGQSLILGNLVEQGDCLVLKSSATLCNRYAANVICCYGDHINIVNSGVMDTWMAHLLSYLSE